MSRVLAVALLSAATLGYEILLVRVFAIEHFHHFAYMAIGVAMLGIGAAGTFLALAPPRDAAAGERWLPRAATLTALTLLASPALAHGVALDATRLTWDPGQWSRLAGVYALLALPFALGAVAVLLALSLERARPGRLYGASFIGSGAGAALAVAALWILPPDRALALAAPVAGGAALILVRSPLSLAATGLAVVALARPLWRIVVTPYKGLPQVEAYPEARRVAERTSPVGWVVAVRAPAFRFAPGLSLAYSGAFPDQTALFSDGALTGALSHWTRNPSAKEMLDWLPTALPYVLPRRERVLVVGAGGGTEVWNAAGHGARRVVALELSPDLVELARRAAPPPGTGFARVEWVTGDARSYLERSPHRFDPVTLGPSGGLGSSAAGVHALSEDFLHT
ncbi:MAG: methyltransferase domain-containing protein, partial [Gemmatimonadales bacterium]